MPSIRYASVEQTRALGERLGRAAFPGAVVALVGDLGVGKTALAQGVGEGLGVVGLVTSPTFILARLHEDGRLPLLHADLYRLADEEEAELVGLPEALVGEGIALVEWADKLPGLLPEDHLRIELSWVPGAPGQRDVVLSARGPRHRVLEGLLAPG
jgi:tRNA threonylcarbamoyladenosine biosynthesis protein TsaE